MPICYTHFTWLFSLIIKNTMAYPLYFTANAMCFFKETYINIAAWDSHSDHCQWNKHSSGTERSEVHFASLLNRICILDCFLPLPFQSVPRGFSRITNSDKMHGKLIIHVSSPRNKGKIHSCQKAGKYPM